MSCPLGWRHVLSTRWAPGRAMSCPLGGRQDVPCLVHLVGARTCHVLSTQWAPGRAMSCPLSGCPNPASCPCNSLQVQLPQAGCCPSLGCDTTHAFPSLDAFLSREIKGKPGLGGEARGTFAARDRVPLWLPLLTWSLCYSCLPPHCCDLRRHCGHLPLRRAPYGIPHSSRRPPASLHLALALA